MAEPAVVQMVRAKETPGTVVFREVEQEGKPTVIGTLYLKKWFAGKAKVIAVAVSITE